MASSIKLIKRIVKFLPSLKFGPKFTCQIWRAFCTYAQIHSIRATIKFQIVGNNDKQQSTNGWRSSICNALWVTAGTHTCCEDSKKSSCRCSSSLKRKMRLANSDDRLLMFLLPPFSRCCGLRSLMQRSNAQHDFFVRAGLLCNRKCQPAIAIWV